MKRKHVAKMVSAVLVTIHADGAGRLWQQWNKGCDTVGQQ